MRLGSSITFRVSPDTKIEFLAKAKKDGDPSDILRELMLAYIEGRLLLTPPKPKGIYHVD